MLVESAQLLTIGGKYTNFGMARAGDVELELDLTGDDDIIEILYSPRVTRSRPGNEGLILPQPGGSQHFSSHPANLDSRRRRRTEQRMQAPAQPRLPQQPEAVIDLTEEPDSPVEQRVSQPPPNPRTGPGRNPRRTNSQRITPPRLTPPRLARSESIFLASQTSFIDLTGEDDLETLEQSRRSLRNNHHPSLRPDDRLVELEFLNSTGSFAGTFARGFGRTIADLLRGDILTSGFRAQPFGISADVFRQREPSPKPPVPTTPQTRPHFTRDTCAAPEAGSEKIVICPACSEELAYDPNDTTAQASSSAPNGGSRKRKRGATAGEHHFWALKKCGHVYCASCYENRRPTKQAPQGVGFERTLSNELRCAVEECETKVLLKTDWVGIFL